MDLSMPARSRLEILKGKPRLYTVHHEGEYLTRFAHRWYIGDRQVGTLEAISFAAQGRITTRKTPRECGGSVSCGDSGCKVCRGRELPQKAQRP